MPPGLKKKYPKIFIDWHPILNEKLNPNSLKKKSRKKVWWKCHKKRCGHTWGDSLYGRIILERGCPQCKDRLKNRSVKDNYEIKPTMKEMENLLNEMDPLIDKLMDEDAIKAQRTRASTSLRRKIIKFERLNKELRKAILKQKKFEINKKKNDE